MQYSYSEIDHESMPGSAPLSGENHAATRRSDFMLKSPFKAGDPMVWLSGAAVSLVLFFFMALVFIIAYYGLQAFWVKPVRAFTLHDGTRFLGSIHGESDGGERLLIFTGNREFYPLDFRRLDRGDIATIDRPENAVVVERMENGKLHGFVKGVSGDVGLSSFGENPTWKDIRELTSDLKSGSLKQLQRQEKVMTKISRLIPDARRALRLAEPGTPEAASARDELDRLQNSFEQANQEYLALSAALQKQRLLLSDIEGRLVEVPLVGIVRIYAPNQVGFFGKCGIYISKLWELLTAYPREANTEGGLFPAIFGTILLVLIMSLFCLPLGVITAVYLREYAKEGFWVNLIRVAVNNLAGVPSIVFGMFGLGFFVYGVGGAVDRVFFGENLPLPTLGTGGLLWAGLTMALLTLPVVIVATEEGLNAVPQGLRDGSLALGAGKFQTLVRVVLPMAAPGMMTGLILAIARAAGEVAPLMLVGVVKSVSELPVDRQAPFLHLDRKFMHLGFHIFDVGFQSPNVEAAKPMVYMTTLLLLFLVLGMSLIAGYLRDRVKKRYRIGAF